MLSLDVRFSGVMHKHPILMHQFPCNRGTAYKVFPVRIRFQENDLGVHYKQITAFSFSSNLK